MKKLTNNEIDTRVLDAYDKGYKKALEDNLKFLKRIKLEFDVNICECGEKWSKTDGADYIKEEIKRVKNLINKKDE